MKTRISSRGRFVLPVELRQQDGIEPGEEFEIERVDRGEYRLRRRTRRRNEGLVKLLLACPFRGWFTSLDRTQTTDDAVQLPVR